MSKPIRTLVGFCSLVIMGGVLVLLAALSESCANNNAPATPSAAVALAKPEHKPAIKKNGVNGCVDFCGDPMPCDCTYELFSNVSPIVCIIDCPSPTPCVTCTSIPPQQYGQNRGPWAPSALGFADLRVHPKWTIGRKGCLLTCWAMIYGFDPGYMNTLFKSGDPTFGTPPAFDQQTHSPDLNQVIAGEITAEGVVWEGFFDNHMVEAFCRTLHPHNAQWIIANVLHRHVTPGQFGNHFTLIVKQQNDPNTQTCRWVTMDPAEVNPQYIDDTTVYRQIYGLENIEDLIDSN